MNRICPSCGRTENSSEFVKNFCIDCFSQHFPLLNLPNEVEVYRCQVCKRIKISKDWVEETQGALKEIVTNKLKSPYSPVITRFETKRRGSFLEVFLEVKFTVEGAEFKKRYSTFLKFERTQCFECSRQTGGFFDSIVQIRFHKDAMPFFEKLPPKIKKLSRFIQDRGGRVAKVEEDENGVDVFVSGITAAMQASQALSSKVIHTRKLIGRKNGKDLYRHTFCIRI